jgi:hypothetical protein
MAARSSLNSSKILLRGEPAFEDRPARPAPSVPTPLPIRTWAIPGTLHLLTPEDGGAWKRDFGATPQVVDALRDAVRQVPDGALLPGSWTATRWASRGSEKPAGRRGRRWRRRSRVSLPPSRAVSARRSAPRRPAVGVASGQGRAVVPHELLVSADGPCGAVLQSPCVGRRRRSAWRSVSG